MSKRVITLGTWEGKPIEWLVLKEEKNQTLVISKIPLFSLKLSWDDQVDSWIGSSLRKYLNNDFYNSAFNSEEKKMIVNSYLSDPDSTKDDVFLLSCDEADEYMTEDERMFVFYREDFIYCYKYIEECNGTCCLRPSLVIRER